MSTLTKKQIARQDFVDNQIFNLINSLLSPSRQIEWNLEVIGRVREVIEEEVTRQKSISERKFYPFIKI